MCQPSQPRGEQWTRWTYAGPCMTVTPAARPSQAHDVQPLLDLAVVMSESDDVEAIVDLATAAVPTLAACRCLGVIRPTGRLPDGPGTVAYPVQTTSFDHGHLVVQSDAPLAPEEDQ